MSEEEIKFVERPFQKVSVKPGDVIILSHPEILSKEGVNNITNIAKKVFPDNKVLILDEGIKIGVVEKEEYVDLCVEPPEFHIG